jgi:glutamate--cysteine ligase
MRFLDVFLLHCLQTPSPPDSPAEIAALARNQHRVAERGREPGLLLEQGATQRSLADWGLELVDQLQPIAAQLDAANQSADYTRAVAAAKAGLLDADSVPSARVLQAVKDQPNGSFVAFVRTQSRHIKETMLNQPLAFDVAQRFEQMAETSLQEQRELEMADSLSFDTYLQQYLAPGAA